MSRYMSRWALAGLSRGSQMVTFRAVWRGADHGETPTTDITGAREYTTAKASWVVMAASMALPPLFQDGDVRLSLARGWADTTAPVVQLIFFCIVYW